MVALDSVEMLVLQLTARGYSLKQVAYELDVSMPQACQTRREALNKVGAENACQFVAACASGRVPGFGPGRLELGSVTMTPAELEVARQVARGHSNRSIAERRGTACRTVANQVQGLYRKWKVQSRLELAIVMGAGGHL